MNDNQIKMTVSASEARQMSQDPYYVFNYEYEVIDLLIKTSCAMSLTTTTYSGKILNLSKLAEHYEGLGYHVARYHDSVEISW